MMPDCPTCGSDDPAICRADGDHHGHPAWMTHATVEEGGLVAARKGYCCRDPFHESASPDSASAQSEGRWTIWYCPDPDCGAIADRVEDVGLPARPGWRCINGHEWTQDRASWRIVVDASDGDPGVHGMTCEHGFPDPWHCAQCANPQPSSAQGDRCPTCGEAGPDVIEPVGDYGGGPYEARCGDEWHEGQAGQWTIWNGPEFVPSKQVAGPAAAGITVVPLADLQAVEQRLKEAEENHDVDTALLQNEGVLSEQDRDETLALLDELLDAVEKHAESWTPLVSIGDDIRKRRDALPEKGQG